MGRFPQGNPDTQILLLGMMFCVNYSYNTFAFEIFHSLATIYSAVTYLVLISNVCLIARPRQIMS